MSRPETMRNPASTAQRRARAAMLHVVGWLAVVCANAACDGPAGRASGAAQPGPAKPVPAAETGATERDLEALKAEIARKQVEIERLRRELDELTEAGRRQLESSDGKEPSDRKDPAFPTLIGRPVPPEPVPPAPTAAVPPAPRTTVGLPDLRGVVQAASDRDNVFVISIGRTDGVCQGDRLRVLRGGSEITTIEIDSVFPSHAAGHRTEGKPKAEIRPGDAVRLSERIEGATPVAPTPR